MWNTLALVAVSGALALAIIVSWTVLIVFGFAEDVPDIYSTMLPTLITGGIIGAAFRQGENKVSP